MTNDILQKKVLEYLTTGYHERREGGCSYSWGRFVGDPIEVRLEVNSKREATGDIRIMAYLVDHTDQPLQSTSRNLRDLVRRMDFMESRDCQAEPKQFYRGVEVRYAREINADKDIEKLVEDYVSLL